MIKVLVLAYYFPPSNGIAAWRPYSWLKYFPENNIQPTVITRHWTGEEIFWEDNINENLSDITIERGNDFTIIRLPYKHSLIIKIAQSRILKLIGLSRPAHFILQLGGRFSIEIDAYYAFKKFVGEYLKENHFDAIIVSSPPLNLIRLAHESSTRNKMPFIADFRDLWTNDELILDYKPTLNKKIKNNLIKFYLKGWLKNVSFVTTVSLPLADKLRGLTKQEVVEITNGFEEELFNHQTEKPSTVMFTISVIGTLYPKQDISVMLDGLKKFLDIVNKQNVKINFIGVEVVEGMAEEIKSKLPAECIYTSPRLPRKSAVSYTLNSHVLLYAAWKKYQGVYSGKIFDYLGARRNILIAPGDDNVIDEIILKSSAGKIANTPEEVCTNLVQWHDEWKRTGQLAYHGNDEIIDFYTRKNQAKILAEKIKSFITGK